MTNEEKLNTNMASEYHVLSCLYRIGANAYLTLGNKNSVDIIVVKKNLQLTIDVKGLQGNSGFPIDNWTKKDKNHFIVFVAYNNKIADTNHSPEIHIVPANELELTRKELDGQSLIYVSPTRTRMLVQLCKLRRLKKYKDNWKPFM